MIILPYTALYLLDTVEPGHTILNITACRSRVQIESQELDKMGLFIGDSLCSSHFFTHSVTHSLSHSVTHSLSHSLTQSRFCSDLKISQYEQLHSSSDISVTSQPHPHISHISATSQPHLRHILATCPPHVSNMSATFP